MKKRLLSAALALAMVLALLPVSVFAVYQQPTQVNPDAKTYTTGTGANQQTHYFYESNPTTGAITTVQVQRCTTPGDGTLREYGKWYWLDNKNDPQNPTYYEVTTGVIAGNNGAGNWYPSFADFTKTAANGSKSLVSTSFTLLGATNANMADGAVWTSTTLNVDFAGSGTLTINDYVTNVTATSKFESTPTGTVAAINRDHSAYATAAPYSTALTLNATNLNVGAITLKGRANTVTLTNCVAGAINMDGTTVTSAAGATTYSAQKLTATNTSITGGITIDGDGSSVALTSVTGGSTLSVKGKGTTNTVNIGGASNVGAVTVASRAINAQDTANAAIPGVIVTGGTVASIDSTSDLGPGKSNFQIDSTTGAASVGAITTKNGDVKVGVNATTGAITVPQGSVTLAGPLTTGVLTLGATGATTLSITGNGSDIAGITMNGAAANLTIRSWPTGRNNDFGTVNLGSYAGRGITGGTFDAAGGSAPFTDAAKLNWINTTSTGLLYQVKAGTKFALYGKNELGEAIESLSNADAKTLGSIVVLGQAASDSLTLMYGDGELAVIGYNALTPVILPSRINSKNIVSWMLISGNSVVKSFISGQEYTIPAGGITVNATNVSEDVAKITSVTARLAGNNASIRAELNGNTINLSGAIGAGVGGVTGIVLDLTTDVIGTDGNPVVLQNVPVDFNNATKATQFNAFWAGSNGATTKDGKLILANGTTYTVSGSGLAVPAGNVEVAGATNPNNYYQITASVGGRLSGWKQEAKDKLIKELTDGTSTGFEFSNNAAMLEAINAAQASITSDTTVTNWVKTAQTNIWRSGFKSPDAANNTAPGGYAVSGGGQLTPHSGNINNQDTDGAAIIAAFDQAYIVPYLQVNVTDYDASGILAATLQPMYRVDVSASGGYDPDMAYTVQQGRALSALTGDMATSPVKVKFNLGPNFASKYMHQDGKYVYAGNGGVWTINHAGGTGLGTIQINGVDGLISLDQPTGVTKFTNGKYDSLQAAVDDTQPEVKAADGTVTYSKVKISGAYSGSCTFNMTGAARTIKIEALGNKDVSCTSNYVDKTTIDGVNYVFQLKRDTVVAGNVTVAVAAATNGTASVSSTKAKAGDTITITTVPNTGYRVTSISAKTNTGAAVTVTATDTPNQYTLVVPTGATSVTVTPVFGQSSGQANIAVNSNAYGAVVPNKTTAKPGETVMITTAPSTGYRTLNVTVQANTGSVYVSKLNNNSYSFVVPNNATSVVVTPTFDRETNLPYLDVLSTEPYLDGVRFCYNKGLMQGDGSTTVFNGNGTITRAQLVTILYRMEKEPAVTVTNRFADVPATEWYAKAVAWAAANNIVGGSVNAYGAKVFNPDDPVSRQDMATILYRYNVEFKKLSGGNKINLNNYTDRGRVADYALNAMQWCVGNQIIGGTSATTLSPNDTAIRYQAATILMRYCQRFLSM